MLLKGGSEGLNKSDLGGEAQFGDANDELRLGDVEGDCAVEAVPNAEDTRIVGMAVTKDDGVVDGVHAGGDEELAEKGFKAEGQAEARMVEDDGGEDGALPNLVLAAGRTEEEELSDAPGNGEEEFAEVEAEGGGGVHVEVGVVRKVKAPKEGDAVHEGVPEVHGVVHEEEDQHWWKDALETAGLEVVTAEDGGNGGSFR